MFIEDGYIVEIKYELRDGGPEGETLELMSEEWPLKFLFGAGAMLPAFEANLRGLEEGQPFQFLLQARDAYGPHEPEQVVQVFLDEIAEDPHYPINRYETGDLITLNTEEGKVISGSIQQITDRYLLVDCNHSMAGKDLHFSGQVLHIREARWDERQAQRYIEPNGFRSHSTLRQPPNH
ncbi:MAG: hypothetical protein AAGB22_09840 [Bacteroidota bacterium]